MLKIEKYVFLDANKDAGVVGSVGAPDISTGKPNVTEENGLKRGHWRLPLEDTGTSDQHDNIHPVRKRIGIEPLVVDEEQDHE